MKACEMTIETPRGTFKIHTIYDNKDEAEADGWGIWFQHENWIILGRNNRVGAVVESGNWRW